MITIVIVPRERVLSWGRRQISQPLAADKMVQYARGTIAFIKYTCCSMLLNIEAAAYEL